MIQPPINPFIASPEKLNAPPMNSLNCFLDKHRGCGPDCMSYALNTPGDQYNEPWCHCIALVSVFRISKHMVIMAQQNGEMVAMAKTNEADAVRTTNAPSVQSFTPPTPKKAEP
jgi:hypothetical protein